MEPLKYRIDLNKLLPFNPVTVECGVAEGNLSRHICEFWKPQLHYCVDNWATIEGVTGDGNFPQEWHDMNLAITKWKLYNYRHLVKYLKGPSWRMAQHVQDESVDLVYLDAGHYYEAVKMDLEAWWPRLKPGGVMAGHDFSNPAYGVEQAAREFAQREGINLVIIPEDKAEDAGFYFIKPKK